MSHLHLTQTYDDMYCISCSFMVREAATSGLPNVVGHIEVSAKTKYNIEELANKIYNTAWDLKAPGL